MNSKDPTTYTGPEQSIKEMLSNDDIGWFPIERATILEKADLDLIEDKEDNDDDHSLQFKICYFMIICFHAINRINGNTM